MSEGNGQLLPPGWAVAPIEDLFWPLEDGRTLHQGWSPQCEKAPAPTDADWGVLKTTAIQAGAFLPQHNKHLPKHLSPRPQTEVKAGDLLITCAGPRVRCGVACLVRSTRPRLMMSGKMYRFRVSPDHFDPRYLEAFLLTPAAHTAIDKMKTGGSDSGLNLTHNRFRPLPVPVAPLKEQQRIMDMVEELLSDLDAAVAALARVQAKLKHYRAAVLNAAVEGALTGGGFRFSLVALRTIIEGLGQGWSPKCDLNREPRDDEWAIIKTTAVQSMQYRDDESKPLPEGLKPRLGIEIKAGDMLMTRKGPRQRAGVACLVRSTRKRRMICDTVYRFRCKVESVQPRYLELALNSPKIVAEIDKRKSGINDSGVSLTHQKLGDVIIPLPTLVEQNAIVEAVEDQLSVIDHLEADLEAKLKSAQALRQSILRHAFTGQLLPQDPNDEPAAKLLKGIAADREKRLSAKQTTRKTSSRAKEPSNKQRTKGLS